MPSTSWYHHTQQSSNCAAVLSDNGDRGTDLPISDDQILRGQQDDLVIQCLYQSVMEEGRVTLKDTIRYTILKICTHSCCRCIMRTLWAVNSAGIKPLSVFKALTLFAGDELGCRELCLGRSSVPVVHLSTEGLQERVSRQFWPSARRCWEWF